jgi:hypothetical protein
MVMVILRPEDTYKEADLRDSRKAVLRTPDWRDLDGLLAFIVELVEERAEIVRTMKPSRNEEAEWLGRRLALFRR